MNGKQQVSLLIGLIALLLIWLVPPWRHVDSDGVVKSMGYSPLWQPPVHTETQGANILGLKFELKESEQANAIDWQRLVGEGAVVLIASGVAFALFAKTRKTAGI